MRELGSAPTERLVQLCLPEEIASAWKVLSSSFDPPLESTIADLDAYAKKLAAHAMTIACQSSCAEILGCISFYANDMQSFQAYIAEFATARASRHKGIGKKLIACAFDVARSKGMRSIRLEVRKDNHVAQHFYRKQGFSLCGEGERTVFLDRPL